MHLNGDCYRMSTPPRADDEVAGDDDLLDRGLVPFAMWLFARRHPWRVYGVAAAAQAKPPEVRLVQLVPAQQSVAIGSHASPAAAQRAPLGAGMAVSSVTHAVAPVGPAQSPLQQSSPAPQAAPSGAHVP
jgi:hypothetical protein